MSNISVFIEVHGRPGMLEAQLSQSATIGELRDALVAAALTIDEETFIFVDEADCHLQGIHNEPIAALKHGARIHLSRCKRIKTMVHFLERTVEHEFPPGARVRRVKEWAVHKLEIDPKDAAEHVLQICKSTERPPSDTPLHQLVHEHNCALCFDLVPEKRVEG